MTALPAGMLTVLFTDLEGSARRWEMDPAGMGAALATHDEIIAGVVVAHGGCVFKHTGDGFAAVFSTAMGAGRAAIEVQRRLQSDDWDHGDRVAVRIGLHTGELEPTEGDYFGPVVNRAARTMGVANGNQIACSAATAALLGDIEARSEGYHELRGIGIEEVYLILSDDIAVDGRPFRQPIEPSNLPSIPTSFLGRDDDMTRLVALLEGDGRVVTVLGPGGVGKTRLAIEVGSYLQSRYVGGVHFCDLAPIGAAEAVEESIAEVIGARRQPGMDLAASIVDFVDGLGLLLILDNCEHVIEPVRILLERLGAVEGASVLVTTREAVGLAGEQLLALGPLDVGAAGVELFVDRARERDPAFELTADNEDSVRDVVRHLDGIPLAIELAAARIRVMTPAELVARLDDRFRLLRGGRRGERHQTLRDTVRWSYDLLTSTEAALFARLSVFAGGFTLSAAEAVCADRDPISVHDVPDMLMALVDKSMVTSESRAGVTRFGLLETLRSFSQEILAESGESGEYRDRHARWGLDLATVQGQRLFSPAESDAWLTLDREWDNLRLAFDAYLSAGNLSDAAELVESLAWFAVFSMRFELFSWASQLLEVDGIEANDHFSNMCGAAALGHYFTVDDRATPLARRGLAADQEDTLGLCRTSLAAVYLNNVHAADASRALTTDWLASNPKPYGNRLWAHAFRTFHLCTYEPGPEGDDMAGATAKIARESSSPSALAVARWAEGQAVAITDRETARQIWAAGLDWARSLPSNNLLEHLLVGLILHFHVRRGDLREVLRLCESAVSSALRHHYLAGASHLLGVSAIALTRSGDADTGARLLGAMVANGHLPRRNAVKALELRYGDELPSRMRLGENLSVNEAAQLALHELARATASIEAEADSGTLRSSPTGS